MKPITWTWFEEPIHADDVGAHRRLSQSTSVPIVVGESMYSLSQFKDYLEAGACSIVQVDVGRIGGITTWLKVAHMAEAFNVPVCPHFLMEIHLTLCCVVPNSRKAIPSDSPGLGIDWDWAALDRSIVHRRSHGASPGVRAGA